LLSENFPRVLTTPEEIEPRGGVQLGACFAGLAIENSMLGAAHAMANPLTAKFGITHGQAVGVMMPHVIAFNAPVAGDAYCELFSAVEGSLGSNRLTGVERLADLIARWLELAELKICLKDLGVEKSVLTELADLAAQQWTAGFNPRKVEVKQFHELYLAAF
jgi:alcohol dehydrogenase